jgi:2-polyprenyl-3-methyl-5-hydroxy-6-metoxy-1,4-benzoquinol methylase
MSDEPFSRAMFARERAVSTGHDYAAYHSRRYDYVIAKCLAYKSSPETTVLDVGRSPLTLRLCEHYRRVTSLGFALSEDQKQPAAGVRYPQVPAHIEFDLNDVRNDARPKHDDRFELIVFGETIEHLVAPPELVLNFLKTLLARDGIIICQTPNAVSLHKRLKMICGFNPYERLRIDVFNPGHIREYTKQELIEVGHTAGLEVVDHEYRDYFGVEGSAARRAAIAISKAISLVIPSLSRGQTIIYRAAKA